MTNNQPNSNGIPGGGNGMMGELANHQQFVRQEPQEESAWAFIGFAWRRKWLVVFVVIMAFGLGYLHFLRTVPVYQSSAQLLVIQNSSVLPVTGVDTETSYDNTLDALFRSPKIISKAVERLDMDQVPSLKASSNPVSSIIQGLASTAIEGKTGEIVRFTYTSEAQAECPKVLEAVMEVYVEFLGESKESVYQETIDLIGQAKDQLGKEISELTTEYRRFRDETPLVWNGTDGANPHEGRMASIDQMRSGVVLENYQVQAKIEAIEDALERGASREALNLMIGQVESANAATRGPTATVEDGLFPMLLEEQILLGKYGPDHPLVQELRNRIQLTRQHRLGGVSSQDGGDKRDFYQVYLDSLREQIKLGEQKVQTFDELYEKERVAARQLTKYQVESETLKGEIERKERLFDAIVKRLEEISFVEEVADPSLVKTELIAPPSRARQIEPDMQKILTTAGLLGALAGLGLAFVVDSADKRFRSPDDIQQQLALPIVGHIPVISSHRQQKIRETADESGLDTSLVTHHAPQGRTCEAYRAVRTAMFFSTRGGGHKLIQVTSPHAGDGKTTLAANLAISIAQSGKRTLLMEADFRRPRVHKVFGLGESLGVCNVIADGEELSDVVHETSVEHLSVIPCGPRPNNPSELLTSPRFEQLLEVLREKYEYVIVDSPPVLAVTDPTAVAPRVDGVLLVMRLTRNARSASKRAREVLDSIGANVLGVIINGVGQGDRYGYGYGRYGYGKYSYGYQYGSGYGYGYGYQYGGKYEYSDKKYYREDNSKKKLKRT
jgi:capsular exopolysaccharide synthesis family protein